MTLVLAFALVAGVSGCATEPGRQTDLPAEAAAPASLAPTSTGPPAESSGGPDPEPSAALRATASTGAAAPARSGRTAESARLRFVPERVAFAGRSVGVVPAATVAGDLQIPEGIDRAAWWDGGAQAGDPFGTTVLAGHVDSPDGVGLFAELIDIEVGEEVSVTSGTETLTYVVTAREQVLKDALATGTVAFDQRGAHRLVLITCWGRWQPELHSYDSNVVVTAEPVVG